MIAVQKTSLAQRVVMALFFSVFLLAGCGFTYALLIHPIVQGIAARQWMAVPCRVISSEVKRHPGKNGSTYSVEVAYAYQVDGKEYRGERYRFLKMSSSGYAGKAAVVSRFPPESEATCYVNPKNPSEAVLNRDCISEIWWGLFPLVFVAIGLAGVIGAFRAGKKPSVDGSNQDSGKPWLLRPDWAAGRVSSSTKKMMMGIWVFAAFWNLISTPVGWMVLSDQVIKKGNYGPAFVLIFPIIGLGLLFWAVTLTLRWLRFGESVFEMACVPGAVGGVLEGTIRLSRPMRPEGPVKLRLNCIARTTSRGGNSNSTSERILWQHEEAVEMNTVDAIPVAFFIPENCSETTTIDASDGTLWRLEAKAKMSGVDYAASFEVPVFRVEQSPELRAEAAKLVTREKAEVAAYVQPATSRIRVQMSLRGGTEFYFPACRNPETAMSLTVFLAIWSGAIWLMTTHGAPMFICIVFGLGGVFLAWATAASWTGTKRVLVSREGVTVKGAVLGIGRTKTVAAQEIESIKTQIGMTSGTTAYHDIKINCRDESTVTAGSSIKDGLEAEWLAAEMTKALAGK